VGFRFSAKMQSLFQKLQIFLVSSLHVVYLLSYPYSAEISNVAMLLIFTCISEENVERDAVHKALMSLIRQDVKSKIPIFFFWLFTTFSVLWDMRPVA
jgi:hypothetical protein